MGCVARLKLFLSEYIGIGVLAVKSDAPTLRFYWASGLLLGVLSGGEGWGVVWRGGDHRVPVTAAAGTELDIFTTRPQFVESV